MNSLRESILDDIPETVCTCRCGDSQRTYKVLTEVVIEDLNNPCSVCGTKLKAGRMINWSPLTHKMNIIETLKRIFRNELSSKL